MDKSLAIKINQLVLQHSEDLNDSLREVQKTCVNEEFESYRSAVGQIMGTMLCDIMNPIYAIYPDIMPDGMR